VYWAGVGIMVVIVYGEGLFSKAWPVRRLRKGIGASPNTGVLPGSSWFLNRVLGPCGVNSNCCVA
jgi:hypothetical protein